ncbi:hypothetical protein [Spirillospora sp. CA-294931]|uniref:hypothetical protein n=1 Tax=Spirillospora sp. CA-294931 TaxID=3240042 RepID=UPI003D934AA8
MAVHRVFAVALLLAAGCISANGINQADRLDPAGMTGRGLLVQKHLELWRTWVTRGGTPFGQRFRNAIDFTRIGTMGHSRGGEGVLRHVQINAAQKGPFGVRAVMPLASTNHHRPLVTDVPLAVVLPQCDGDLSDQPGVHYYDEGRHTTTDETPWAARSRSPEHPACCAAAPASAPVASTPTAPTPTNRTAGTATSPA